MTGILPQHEESPLRPAQLLEAGRNAQHEDKGELAYHLLCQCLKAAHAVNDIHCAGLALIALVENTSLFAPREEADIFDYRERLCIEALDHFQAIQEPVGMANAMRLLAREKPSHEAKAMVEQSLAMMRSAGDATGIIKCLDNLGHLAFIEGDRQLGQKLKNEALTHAIDKGDKEDIARVLFSIALTEKDGPERVARFEEAARLFEEQGRIGAQAQSLAYCAILACDDSQVSRKESHLHRAIELCREIGNNVLVSTCYDGLAEAARQRGDETLATYYESASRECSDIPQIVENLAFGPAKLNYETLRELMRQVMGAVRNGNDTDDLDNDDEER